MKKLLVVALVAVSFSAQAWNKLGHRTIVEIAKRHLTENTKENIAKYMPYDITKDALWMDYNRGKKSPYRFTNSWHSYYYDAKLRHDPNVAHKIQNGDTMRGLDLVTYNLENYKELSDSAVVLNIRAILHFVGDMHCPTHSYVPGPRCFWDCTLNGKAYKFHGVYDKMPQFVHEGKKPDQIADELDVLKKSEIKKIVKGDLHEWVHQVGSDNKVIYEWNPHNTPVLNEKTVELSAELVNKQMQRAGYRLAYLLNLYFDK